MLTLTDNIVDILDEHVENGRYVSRSEIVRAALRSFFRGE